MPSDTPSVGWKRRDFLAVRRRSYDPEPHPIADARRHKLLHLVKSPLRFDQSCPERSPAFFVEVLPVGRQSQPQKHVTLDVVQEVSEIGGGALELERLNLAGGLDVADFPGRPLFQLQIVRHGRSVGGDGGVCPRPGQVGGPDVSRAVLICLNQRQGGSVV